MFKSDQPIRSHKEDMLGRTAFARALGNAILSHKEKDSVAIGLYGAWGLGKTSIINLVLEYIEFTSKKKSDKRKPIIVKFNPWNYSDQNQLVTQFFRQLSMTLRGPDYTGNVKKAGERLETYGKFLEPLGFIPIIGGVAGPVGKIFKIAGSTAKNWADAKSSDLNVLRDELNELLQRQFHKIIVVIDDIDRLNNTEIRQIFQLVKSLGDFPNTIYLLAFDKDIVINALRKVQESPGEEYLEKVIQVPFEVPLISKREVEHLLLGQLETLIADIPENKWDRIYWGNTYHGGLKYFFDTIRDVIRYINTLRFSFEMVKGEVNPIDFLATTGIQVFMPEVYYGIRDNKDIFSGVFDSGFGSNEAARKQAKKRCDEIMKRTKRIPPEVLTDFLKSLFPKLESIYGGTSYGSDWLDDWRRNGRICSPDIFDTFFRLSIPKGEMSQKEIEIILSLGNNPDALAEALLGLNKQNRITRFLERLEDYTRSEIPEENIEPIIAVLMDIGDVFPEGDSGFASIDNPMKILRLFYQLSHRFDTQKRRFGTFKDAIGKATRSLYTIVDEVSVQDQQHGKYTSKEKPTPEEERTVNPSQLRKLEKLALEKIRTWAEDGRLGKHRNLAYILFRWRDWGKTTEPVEFVEKMIERDEGLIDFITGFLSKSTSHGIGDYVGKIEWRIHLKSIEEFVDVEELEPRIRKIFSSSTFEEIGDQKKLAIKTFLDTVDGKTKDRF